MRSRLFKVLILNLVYILTLFFVIPLFIILWFGLKLESLLALIILFQLYVLLAQLDIYHRQLTLYTRELEPEILLDLRESKMITSDGSKYYSLYVRNAGKTTAYDITTSAYLGDENLSECSKILGSLAPKEEMLICSIVVKNQEQLSMLQVKTFYTIFTGGYRMVISFYNHNVGKMINTPAIIESKGIIIHPLSKLAETILLIRSLSKSGKDKNQKQYRKRLHSNHDIVQ